MKNKNISKLAGLAALVTLASTGCPNMAPVQGGHSRPSNEPAFYDHGRVYREPINQGYSPRRGYGSSTFSLDFGDLFRRDNLHERTPGLRGKDKRRLLGRAMESPQVERFTIDSPNGTDYHVRNHSLRDQAQLERAEGRSAYLSKLGDAAKIRAQAQRDRARNYGRRRGR